MISIMYGLFSALSWGGADFYGGLASRKTGAYRVVFYGEALGLLLLLAAAATAAREPALGWEKILLAGGAGAIGSLGLLVLFYAMTVGQMSIAAPVSALLAAALPVVVGAVLEGFPALPKLLGFACALLAVWLVAQDGSAKTHLTRLSDLRLPLFAGLCFGTFFVVIHQVSAQSFIWPMLASRAGGTLILLAVVLARRERWQINRSTAPLIILNAILDVGGSAFYILAGQTGRLDVAAVLGSLYPGTTVVLAWLILKEEINISQWLGIGAALAAIVLLTV